MSTWTCSTPSRPARASAVFGGLNTLYAAFAARVRETATLLGAFTARWLLVDRILPFGAGVIELDLEPSSLLAGLTAGLLLGIIGTLPPAFRCLAPPLPQALRD